MSRIIYVNGRYRPYREAAIHAEDRGFQFADGVYEVCEIYSGKLVDEARHLARLKRSLSELRMRAPMSFESMGVVLRETIRRNCVRDGFLYLQVTRGVARRDFAFPAEDVAPTFVCFARVVKRQSGDQLAATGIAAITLPDIRWKRPDIKSVSLLPNALARQSAKEAGAREAWLVDNQGFVTEGAASNAWIIDKEGTLITRPAGKGILSGVTRSVVLDLAKREGYRVIERSFTVQEALDAKEAFVTAATAIVMPVVRIDGHSIGNGSPGTFVTELRKLFHSQAEISP